MSKNILYFDIIGGISGDMTLASLLDLGVPKEIFLEELSKLNMDNEFKIEINPCCMMYRIRRETRVMSC